MKTLFYLSLLFFALASCEPNGLEPVTSPLESEILIQLKEELKEGERNLVLLNNTEEIYPCINYSLLADQVLSRESFKITFKGVHESDLCFTALGPARSEINLGNVPNGDYYMELNNGSVKNKGLLSVSSKKIELVFAQQNGIEILTSELMRVPVHTFWGTIGYHNESAATLVNEFEAELKALGAVFEEQTPGNYWHYQVNKNGEMVLPENHGYYFAKPLIFQYFQNEEALKELILSFGEQHKDKVYLYFNSYKGEQIDGRVN